MNGTLRVVIGVLLAGLAMSLGWGIRGDYGHEAGAMIPEALLGLHVTPPRSDNWAGCVGLFAALLAYLRRQQDRTAGLLAGYGFWIALFLTPIILYWAARLTVAAHAAPLPGSALRLAETFSPN